MCYYVLWSIYYLILQITTKVPLCIPFIAFLSVLLSACATMYCVLSYFDLCTTSLYSLLLKSFYIPFIIFLSVLPPSLCTIMYCLVLIFVLYLSTSKVCVLESYTFQCFHLSVLLHLVYYCTLCSTTNVIDRHIYSQTHMYTQTYKHL